MGIPALEGEYVPLDDEDVERLTSLREGFDLGYPMGGLAMLFAAGIVVASAFAGGPVWVPLLIAFPLIGGASLPIWLARGQQRAFDAELEAGRKWRVTGVVEKKYETSIGLRNSAPNTLYYLVVQGHTFELAWADWRQAQEGATVGLDYARAPGVFLGVRVLAPAAGS